MSLIFGLTLFGAIPCIFSFITEYINQEYRSFENFFEFHPFLATLLCGVFLVGSIAIVVIPLWVLSVVLSPEPSTGQPPKNPTTILTNPVDKSQTVKVTVGSKISGMPNVKEVKIELTVDSVAAKDVHYTQDIIKDVIKKINR